MVHDCPKNLSSIRAGELVIGCDRCIGATLQHGSSAAFDRRWQQTEYRRDLTQKNQPRQFIQAFGVDKAREHGYSDEQIRKYG